MNKSVVLAGVNETRGRRGREVCGPPRGRQESSRDGGQVRWVPSRDKNRCVAATVRVKASMKRRMSRCQSWLMQARNADAGSSVVGGSRFVVLSTTPAWRPGNLGTSGFSSVSCTGAFMFVGS